jgi:MFS family permease
MRGRQLTNQGIAAFRRAATADGADRSGLTALTYTTMATYAVDAAVAVALANTLFFSAATAESRGKVALYLLITVAPFVLIAPVIGPLLDRIQRGRRAALAVTFAGRAVLALVMAFNFDSWVLYPAALGVMVLSKSYMVLKAAVTPRVLPPGITLVTTNSRLTVFGMVGGGVFGALAAGVAWASGSTGALIFTAILAGAGTWLCMRIPPWVEVTEGEVAASLRVTQPTGPPQATGQRQRPPMGRHVMVALWANTAIRVLTGFLLLFMAFVIKAQTEHSPTEQVLFLGLIGAAAGVGTFAGNFIGARQRFDHSDGFVLACVGATVAGAALAAIVPSIYTAAITTLIAATASAFAKVCLDSVMQRDLPEEARASAFGRSETVLQLAWVFGGALGLLLPTGQGQFWIGFVVVAAIVALGGVQTYLVSRGRTLLPVRRARPDRKEPARA